ncbi:hypothetical protein ABK040_001058 [Willaertia magna]
MHLSILKDRVKYNPELMFLTLNLSGLKLICFQDIINLQQVVQEVLENEVDGTTRIYGSSATSCCSTPQQQQQPFLYPTNPNHRSSTLSNHSSLPLASSSILLPNNNYTNNITNGQSNNITMANVNVNNNNIRNNSSMRRFITLLLCYEKFECKDEELWQHFQLNIEYIKQNYPIKKVEEYPTRLQFDKQLSKTRNVIEFIHHCLQHDHQMNGESEKNNIGIRLDSLMIDKCTCNDIKIIINNRFVLDRMLSKGSYGNVYSGIDKQEKRKVAVKELDLHMMDKIGAIEFAFREIEIMKLIKEKPHERIVSCIEVIEDFICIGNHKDNEREGRYVYIITDFCENGSLENPYEEHEQHAEEDVQRYFVQIVSAIEHMHNYLSILHRDLTLSNVCLDENRNVRIVDFGVSDRFEKGKKYHRRFVGNSAYCCPEILSKKTYAEEIDLYALGVIVYKLLTGYLPFRQAQDKFTMNFSIPLEEEEFMSDDAKEVVRGLLEVNGVKRWKLEDIKMCNFYIQGLKRAEENKVL